MANKIIHKHSNVVNNNKPKLPTKDQLEYGEIAINYAKGNETISLKNSSDEIIEFKSKNYVDEQINSNNERIQAVEDSIDLVNKTIEDNELVTATAITKLEGRTTNVENGLTNKSDIGHTHVSSAITDSISASDSITSGASGLVQGKAVYNYAAPKSHTHSNYSPTGHTHVSSAITDSISASDSITSGASGLVQGKAVYNYAAPKSHASSSTTYGAATTSNYGHVKISNGDVATVASADGLAAGMNHTHSNYSTTGHTHSAYSSTGHTHVSSAITDSISASGSITSGASGLVQGKAVYNYAAPKSHASSATTYGAATTSNYGHVKISNGDVATVASADGLAAGMDHTHSNYSTTRHTHVSSAITDSINSMSGITGTETKLVQAKAVYELINDTEEQIAETLLEHDSRLTTLSNNFDSIVTDIEENELVIATAITDLEDIVNGIGEELDNKSNLNHTHSNYSTTGHTHSAYSPTGHTHVSSAITDSISASGSITSGASGLVQGKAVYNYAAPKSHASSSTTYGVATTSNYGHVKIGNGLTVSNGVLSHPTTSGNKHIPSGGTSGQFLRYTSSGTAAWATPANNTATSAAAGFMSAEDKTKLDKIQNYHKLTIDTSSWDGVGSIPIATALADDVDKFTYIKFGDIIRICSSEEFENLGYPSNPYRNLSIITVDIGEISYRLRCVNSDDFDVQSSSMFGAGFNNFQLGDNDYTFYNALYKFGGYLDAIIVGFDDNVSNGWLYVPIYNSHIGYISNISQLSKSIQVTSTTENATHPLVFTKSVPTGNKSLYTDSANSLHYNPSTDTLTVPYASITTVKASTIANKTSGSTIVFDDTIKMKTFSYVQGTINFKGTDHGNDVISISGGSTTSAPSISIKTKNDKDYVGISMLGKADTTSAAEIKVYGTSTSSYTTIQGGKNAAVTSDERLKDFGDNIEVDFNELKQIPKKYFTWKNDDIKVSNIGTSAQSIEKLYPELVITDDNGYKSLDYSTLSIIALAAIDKLNERIEYLENKLKENEINNL